MRHRSLPLVLAAALLALAFGACTPTVQLEAPKEPITVNLNIKLDADVRLKIEQRANEDVGTKDYF